MYEDKQYFHFHLHCKQFVFVGRVWTINELDVWLETNIIIWSAQLAIFAKILFVFFSRSFVLILSDFHVGVGSGMGGGER